MEIKVHILLLLSLSLFTNSASLNGHQVLSSHDSANDHKQWFRIHALPRKLMLNPKVESFVDKDLMSYNNDDLSGESHNGRSKEAPITTTSLEVSPQDRGVYPAPRMFTMDYSPVKKRRRPVHNKSLPTAITSP